MIPSFVALSFAFAVVLGRLHRIPDGDVQYDAVWHASLAAPDAKQKPDMATTLELYYEYLLFFQDLMDDFCAMLIDFDKLWHWENQRRSLGLLFGSLLAALLMGMIPVNYSCGLMVSMVFVLGKLEFHSDNGASSAAAVRDPRRDEGSAAQRSPSLVEGDWELVTPDNAEVDAQATAANVAQAVGSGQNDQQTVRKRKTDGRPKCASCNSFIDSLLRRRVYCRHCGQQFCRSCCSSKVPRAFFGATSPAAYKQTVRVCRDCKQYLESYGSEGKRLQL